MLRVRWRGAASVAAAVAVLAAGVGAAPALLEPPDPPAIAADVGLPRPPESVVSAPQSEPRPSRREPRREPGGRRDRNRRAEQRSAGDREHRRDRDEPQWREPEPADEPPAFDTDPEPDYVAPVPTAAPYLPPPLAAPTPAGDGSQEFAPR